MSLSESSGPVSLAESQAVVAQLNELAHRSAEHGQSMFHFVFATAAESLSDNLETAAEIDDDSDAG